MVTLFNGRVEYLAVKLKDDWMGNPKGSTLTIVKRQADTLIERGVAKVIEEKKPLLKLRKSVTGPPVDKMLKEPEVNK